MSKLHLLYERSVEASEGVRVVIPTLREILRDEDAYYSVVNILTAQPIDFMVLLDDAGIDFTKINEWELFLLLLPTLIGMDTSLVLEGIRLADFHVVPDSENGQIALVDPLSGVRIDRTVLRRIATVLRKLHHLEADNRKPANEEARLYLLERARIKAKRKKKAESSGLEQLIVALVNTEQFKYDYESVLDLSIYQFNESLYQITKKIEYDNRMHGIYSGTVNPKELSRDDLNWLVHK